MNINPRHWAALLLLLTLVACAVKPTPPPAPPVLVPTPVCDDACLEGFKDATIQILEDLRTIRNIMIYELQLNNPEGMGVPPQA